MPRVSKRLNLVKEYEHSCENRLAMKCIRFYLDYEDSFEDDIDDHLIDQLQKLQSSRYLYRGTYRTWNSNWKRMLHDDVYMNDDEFLANFRMNRDCVMELCKLVENDEVFNSVFGKMAKGSTQLHIMVFLKYLGSYGNEASLQKIGRMMGISKGSVLNYVTRACEAILKLRHQVIKWPNEEERSAISQRIQDQHQFVNCVGLIDGTLFPLAFKPTLNGEDYFTRKGCYAIHGLIICDDKARITWIEMGWPGSVHDN